MLRNNVIFLVLILCSCNSPKMNLEEYKTWISSNKKLFDEKQVDGLKYKVHYMPKEWIAFMSMEGQGQNAYEQSLKTCKDLIYFTLVVTPIDSGTNPLKGNLQNKEQYFERLYYSSFLLKENLKLKHHNVKKDCVLFNYERAYDLSSKLTFTFAFEKAPIGDTYDEDLMLEVRPEVYTNETIKFLIDKDNLNNLPTLQL